MEVPNSHSQLQQSSSMTQPRSRIYCHFRQAKAEISGALRRIASDPLCLSAGLAPGICRLVGRLDGALAEFFAGFARGLVGLAQGLFAQDQTELTTSRGEEEHTPRDFPAGRAGQQRSRQQSEAETGRDREAGILADQTGELLGRIRVGQAGGGKGRSRLLSRA